MAFLFKQEFVRHVLNEAQDHYRHLEDRDKLELKRIAFIIKCGFAAKNVKLKEMRETLNHLKRTWENERGVINVSIYMMRFFYICFSEIVDSSRMCL